MRVIKATPNPALSKKQTLFNPAELRFPTASPALCIETFKQSEMYKL